MTASAVPSRVSRQALTALAAIVLALAGVSTARAGFEIKGANIPAAPKMSGGALQSDSTIAPMDSIGMMSDAANPAVPVTAVPIDAPAPVDQAPMAMMAADASTVSGFGEDLPLVIALQQIAPPGYQFAFAEDVEPGQRVSWQGGKPWRDVLTEMLGTRGLAFDTRDDNVLVVMTEREAAETPVQTVQVTPAKKSGPVDTQDVRRRKPSTMIGRLRAQLTGDSGEAMRQPASTAHADEWDQAEADVAAAPTPVQTPAPAPAPVPVPAPAPVMASELHEDEQAAIPPMVSAEDLSPISLTAAPPARTSLPPDYAPAPYTPPPAYVPQQPVAMSAPMPTMSMPVAARWQAPAGETLRSVLSRWSAEAGVSIFWSIDYDYRLATPVSYDGSFQSAAASLLDQFTQSKPRPYGQLHQPAGNAQTLVVKAYGVN